MIWPFLLAMAIQLVFAVVAVLCGRSHRLALAFATAGSVLASALGVTYSIRILLSGGHAESYLPWQLPIGELHVGVDALSAFFLLCIYLLSGLSSIFGAGYFRDHVGDKRLSSLLFFFATLVVALAGITLARDGVLFLMAWEIMALSMFFLVVYDHEQPEVRRAGLVYLIASHVGVAFLFVLFAMLAQQGGNFSFESMASAGSMSSTAANLCFLLAIVGFGSKDGFWLLHTWLPEAHPVAPGHASAVMSIKIGIYGILRVLTLLGPPPRWWGVTLIVIGAVTGILAVLHALAQRDLKRLLAYSTVENVGIMAMGMGLGLVGQSSGDSTMALLGYGGALLHTLNHGLFKGVLFNGATSVLRAVGTKNIEKLGGLSKKMPATAMSFLVASISICGLPPFNGFVSEWLIYLAAFRGGSVLHGTAVVAVLAVIPSLALIGGLATACFVRAYGVVFLGQGRSDVAIDKEYRQPIAMSVAMILGAALCVVIGIWPDSAIHLIARPANLVLGTTLGMSPLTDVLISITRIGCVLLGVIVVLAILRAALLRNRVIAEAPTWGCGYEAPTPRMQYTASSIAEPVLEPFVLSLHRQQKSDLPTAYFPRSARFQQETGDSAGDRYLLPAMRRVVSTLARLRGLQQGHVQLYLLYILVTVVGLLVWQLSGAS